MPEADAAGVTGAIAETPLALVEPGSPESAQVPERWRPIALAPDAQTRRATALALWNQDFAAMLPRFMAALDDHLVDVRVVTRDDEFALAYVGVDAAGDYVSWVGWDPGTFGERPPFWDRFPAPLRTFLTEVHAGFTGTSGDACGPWPPVQVETVASMAGQPDGLPDFDEAHDIGSSRLLVIMTDRGNSRYCVSPDIPPGSLAVLYEGDLVVREFAAQTDELMVSYLG